MRGGFGGLDCFWVLAFATIGTGDGLPYLKTAQADFETAYQDKVAAKGGAQPPQVIESRKQLMRNVGVLLVDLDPQSEFDRTVCRLVVQWQIP